MENINERRAALTVRREIQMETTPAHPIAGRLVLLAGGTSASGLAAAKALLARGARVIIAGRNEEKLARCRRELPHVYVQRADLASEESVAELKARVDDMWGPVDGVFHLVGGWSGGGGLAAQTEEAFRLLETGLSALRHVSRAFDRDLRQSSAGRTAIVSSVVASRPTDGSANYATLKAAGETWMRAVDHGLRTHGAIGGGGARSFAAVFRVRSLDGVEEALGEAFAELWSRPIAPLEMVLTELHAS
ncbi:SDR family oxidoreductase [Microbacterium sp. LWH10-1.2]|uniref:SDR family oxidoreductase n=1 Tax=unclassified Microbacterium TaxID=2609290 RepID=UPI003139EB93